MAIVSRIELDRISIAGAREIRAWQALATVVPLPYCLIDGGQGQQEFALEIEPDNRGAMWVLEKGRFGLGVGAGIGYIIHVGNSRDEVMVEGRFS